MINLEKLKEWVDKDFKENIKNSENFELICNFEYETITETNTGS